MDYTDEIEQTALDEAYLWDEEESAVIERLRLQIHTQLDKGTTCPVCDQTAREYRRVLNSGMVLALATMYRRGGLDWFHKPSVLRGVGASARDESLLRFWGLIEEKKSKGVDGRSGWWKVTPKGEQFITGTLAVRKYIHIYNGEFIRFSGPDIDVFDAAGERFSLREMLEAS